MPHFFQTSSLGLPISKLARPKSMQAFSPSRTQTVRDKKLPWGMSVQIEQIHAGYLSRKNRRRWCTLRYDGLYELSIRLFARIFSKGDMNELKCPINKIVGNVTQRGDVLVIVLTDRTRVYQAASELEARAWVSHINTLIAQSSSPASVPSETQSASTRVTALAPQGNGTQGNETRGNETQLWVHAVTAWSSQYDSTTWAATQLCGVPKVYPQYGDRHGAWAPRQSRGGHEFIEFEIERALHVNRLEIYETFNPGAIVKICGRNSPGDEWTTMWTGRAEHAFLPPESRIFVPQLNTISVPLRFFRFDLNTSTGNSWSELDAVSVIGHEPGIAGNLQGGMATLEQLTQNLCFSNRDSNTTTSSITTAATSPRDEAWHIDSEAEEAEEVVLPPPELKRAVQLFCELGIARPTVVECVFDQWEKGVKLADILAEPNNTLDIMLAARPAFTPTPTGPAPSELEPALRNFRNFLLGMLADGTLFPVEIEKITQFREQNDLPETAIDSVGLSHQLVEAIQRGKAVTSEPITPRHSSLGPIESALPSDRAAVYGAFLRGMLADGEITDTERANLLAFRCELGITVTEHQRAISELGMTEVEFRQKFQRKGVQGEDSLCVVCLDAPVDSVLVPCGHFSMCNTCAVNISSTGTRSTRVCPICRSQIKEVCRVYKTSAT